MRSVKLIICRTVPPASSSRVNQSIPKGRSKYTICHTFLDARKGLLSLVLADSRGKSWLVPYSFLSPRSGVQRNRENLPRFLIDEKLSCLGEAVFNQSLDSLKKTVIMDLQATKNMGLDRLEQHRTEILPNRICCRGMNTTAQLRI